MVKIIDKDWNRMLNLSLKNENGELVAKMIKDKNKAIARFVSGLKLNSLNLNYNEKWKKYSGSFSDFGNKALTLGATTEEIQITFDENSVPNKFSDKLSYLCNKKLDNRFVGSISKSILDAGFDINYLPHNGNAITLEGKDVMNRNGIKWTIGYKTEIDLGDKTVKFNFDAITDEGGGPTFYLIDINDSSDIFNDIYQYEPVGIKKFINIITNQLLKKNS